MTMRQQLTSDQLTKKKIDDWFTANYNNNAFFWMADEGLESPVHCKLCEWVEQDDTDPPFQEWDEVTNHFKEHHFAVFQMIVIQS